MAISAFENYMFLTGRQSNGENGKDVFFMKFNLDSLFVISGQPEYIVDNDVLVYPNPASNRLYIDINENDAVLNVIDIDGNQIDKITVDRREKK